MKKYIFEFVQRGLTACSFGPVILAIIYLILQKAEAVETLTVHQVCIGIFSLSVLAFIVGGMNMIYQIERLPLMAAILLHGTVLYIGYLITYLLNNWLEWNMIPILVFSGIFVFGYLAIWVIIYCATKKKTKKLNQMLKKNGQPQG